MLPRDKQLLHMSGLESKLDADPSKVLQIGVTTEEDKKFNCKTLDDTLAIPIHLVVVLTVARIYLLICNNA